jgi:hypothetical protein
MAHYIKNAEISSGVVSIGDYDQRCDFLIFKDFLLAYLARKR